MSFNGASYGAAKKLVEGLASGFDHTEKTGDNSFKIYFKNGTNIELTIPQPEIDYDKLEEDMNGYILDWLEEHKDEIKGKDGKTVQILSADETEADIEEEAVLIFQENEFGEMETYNKAQSDVRFAKSVNVGDVSKLTVSTWKDLVTALNDVFGRGMGSYKFEVDENKKQLTIVCRNGAEVPIDISQIILNTNITEFKDMLVTSILDGQSLVWNASKKKWVNKSIDSSGVLVEAKQYTDDEIKKFNNKGSLAVDEKPTYYGGIITYKQGGETKTTDNAGTWFYYFDDNDKAVQTIFIEGTEFTIAMAGDINLDDYVAKTEKTDTYDENFVDKTKVPTTRYMEEFKEVLDEEIGAKVNTADIVDDLTSDAVDKPLSAKQGKELNSTKLNKTTDAENSGKALVVDGSGNIVFGDAGVKVSSEEGNKITEKDDGIFVASEIDDENISENSTFSSKKINDFVPFKLGITEDGQYGYIKDGADTVTPFKSGGKYEFIPLTPSMTTTEDMYNVIGIASASSSNPTFTVNGVSIPMEQNASASVVRIMQFQKVDFVPKGSTISCTTRGFIIHEVPPFDNGEIVNLRATLKGSSTTTFTTEKACKEINITFGFSKAKFAISVNGEDKTSLLNNYGPIQNDYGMSSATILGDFPIGTEITIQNKSTGNAGYFICY